MVSGRPVLNFGEGINEGMFFGDKYTIQIMICQKLCQNRVSVWGSLEVEDVVFLAAIGGKTQATAKISKCVFFYPLVN